MIIKLIPASKEGTAVHQLLQPDMIVDPRPIHEEGFKFEVNVNGTTMTLTRN